MDDAARKTGVVGTTSAPVLAPGSASSSSSESDMDSPEPERNLEAVTKCLAKLRSAHHENNKLQLRLAWVQVRGAAHTYLHDG